MRKCLICVKRNCFLCVFRRQFTVVCDGIGTVRGAEEAWNECLAEGTALLNSSV